VTLEGVDYSYSRPGGAALAAAHKHFVMRYIAHSAAAANLTKAELDDLFAHGLSVGLVCERGAQRTLLGSAAGQVDATQALAAANALGFPDSRPIYFAVDFNATTSQQDAIDSYLRGAAHVLGTERVGVYGSVYVLNRCLSNGTARWGWQTYAWSDGLVSPKAHLIQYRNGQSVGGGSVDLDRSLQADFGVWTPLPDSSTGDAPVITQTITELPYGGGIFTVAAGANPVGIKIDATGTVTGTVTWPGSAHDSSAHFDADVSFVNGPHGSPFGRVVDGTFAGCLVSKGQPGLTWTPNPAPAVDCSADIAAAVAATREKDRQAALDAVGKAIP